MPYPKDTEDSLPQCIQPPSTDALWMLLSTPHPAIGKARHLGEALLHAGLITPVTDRPGHDRRYAIDPTRISTELGWQPRHSFEEGLAATVRWYLEQQGWCRQVREQGGYTGGRLGLLAVG